MKDFVASFEPHRDKLGVILLVLSLPLPLALFWTPWWVAIICILLVPVSAAILIVRILPSLTTSSAATQSATDEAEIHMMRKLSSNVIGLLSHWSQVSSHSHASLEEAHSQVDEVIAYSEAAVIRISNNFISITRKTRKQVEHALGLLESSRTGSGKGMTTTRHSLPELIHAYEHLLQQVTTSLSDIAEKTQQLEQSLNRPAASPDARVLPETQEIHAAYQLAAQQAREAAQAASAEVSKLTGGMHRTGDEVAEALAQIRALGDEIQTDINSIIIDLQFQDFTQQKLQRLKNPVLAELTDALREIVEEARSMSNKLEGSGLIDKHLQTTIHESNARNENVAPASSKSNPSPGLTVPKNDRKPEGDESVELF